MAQVKRWQNRVSGRTDAGALVSGAAGATVTVSTSYDTAPASLYTGFEFSFKAGADCPAAALVAVNGLGNKNLQRVTAAGYMNVLAGDYKQNQHVRCKYDGTLDKVVLLNPIPGGEDLLSVQTASGASTVDFVLATWLSSYRAFKVALTGVTVSTDATSLYLRTSTNAGSSYDAGASDYTWASVAINDTAALAIAQDSADAQIILLGAIDSAATASIDGEVRLLNPASTAFHTKASFDLAYVNNSAPAFQRTTGGGRRVAAADVDAIRFLPAAGTISGGFALYGIR